MQAAHMHKATTATQRTLRPGQLVVTGLLLMAVVGSALMLIYTTHRNRVLFNEWQQQQRREWALDEDWERLLLEQGTLAGYERVSQSAESRLDMVMPDPAAINVVNP
jgi:cell division protein FtsL